MAVCVSASDRCELEPAVGVEYLASANDCLQLHPNSYSGADNKLCIF